MTLQTLFGNQRKLVQTLIDSERSIYFKLLGVSLLSVVLEFLGLAIIYALLIIIFDPNLLLEQLALIVGTRFQFKYVLLCLVVLFALKTVSALLVYRWQLKYIYHISSSLSDRVFNQSFNVSLNIHKKILASDRLMEVNTITNSFPYLVLLPAISALSEMIFVVICVCALLVIKPFLVLALVIALLPQALVLFYVGRKKLKKTGDIINQGLAQQNDLVSQSMLGFSEINLYNLGQQFRQDLNKVRTEVYSHRLKVQLFSSAAPHRMMELLTVLALCIMAVYFYGFNQTSSFYSTLALFAAAAFRLLPSMNRVVMGANTLISFAPMLDLIPAPASSSFDEVTHNIETFKSMEIKDLHFNFDDDVSLFNGLNLKVSKGEFIGLFGESGTGKTTLINLIIGFYELPDQHISVNDYPMSKVKKSWQTKLGYVKQDAFVTANSIAENIAFGSKDIDFDKIKRLLLQVKLWDWVSSLPNGVHTTIGDQGARISGGQKQRLAIARALYREAEVIICDEITTSLDEENKLGIIALIEDLNKNGQTIIMVSHDLSVFKHASSVYELKNGTLHHHQ